MGNHGIRSPVFDGGLVKMNKGGKFSYMSSRNNNFSNRNQVGFMCVKDGAVGSCGGNTCQKSFEDELLQKYNSEDPDGYVRTTTLIEEQKLLELPDAAPKRADKRFSVDDIAQLLGED